MKKLLLLLLLPAMLIVSCSKSKDKPTPTGFEIHLKRNTPFDEGLPVVAKVTKAFLIHIWKTDGIDSLDVYSTGDAADYTHGKMIKALYTYEDVSDISEIVAPGKYQVFVAMAGRANGNGSYAMSTTGFEVKKGQVTTVAKTFTMTYLDANYEPWDAKE